MSEHPVQNMDKMIVTRYPVLPSWEERSSPPEEEEESAPVVDEKIAFLLVVRANLISWNEVFRISRDAHHPMQKFVWANRWFRGLLFGLTDDGALELDAYERALEKSRCTQKTQ